MDLRKWFRGEEVPCYVCGAVTNHPRWTVDSMQFPELEGSPRICSVCVFKAITGDKIEWRSDSDWNVKQYIKYDAPGRTRNEGAAA